MKKSNYFLSSPEILIINSDHKENDLAVISMGYNNFHFVKPITTPRKQLFYSMHFVISGEGTLIIDNESYHVKTNDIFCLDNNSMITYFPDDDNPWEYVFFNFYGNLKDSYLHDVGFSKVCPIMPCLFPQKILSLLSSFFHKRDSGTENASIEMLSAFFTVLQSVESKINQKILFDNQVSVEEIKYYIQLKFLSPDFTIDSLCEFMHISHSHLCRIFRKYQHSTASKYITDLKMNYAEELLKKSKSTVSEICYLTGYESYEHFLRVFKKTHGVTPSEFRNSFNIL